MQVLHFNYSKMCNSWKYYANMFAKPLKYNQIKAE